MRNLLIIILLALCPVVSAQADDQARRITDKPEYRGYRVERPPGAQPSEGGDGSSDGNGGSRSSGSDGGSSDPGARRGTGSGPQRGSGSGGGGWGSGGGGGGLSAPLWLGGLLEILAWIILIAGVAIALFFIVKALLGIRFKGRKKSQKSARKKTEKAEPETAAATEEPISIDAQVFEDALQKALRDYQQALANEDYAAATLLAYRIFWLRAGWQGCVETTDVRTWRDALRMVRAAEIRQEVRALLPMVERVRYAEYRPHKGEFNTWSMSLERIEPTGVLK